MGTGNVRMWGLQALPDTGAPRVVGKSLRGRSTRADPVALAEPEPPAASPDDGRTSRGGSGSAAARAARDEPSGSVPAAGRRDGGAP
ncbi:hypothetical protein ABZ646_02010 [Streptomyces sp. NPDC007162]|uniref:hypothetical protein n=1 Tax=Streptomyces sp. NPDC007162 TaxID=3156917 RepID=UPI0033F81FD7